jgi:hypothetical protein
MPSGMAGPVIRNGESWLQFLIQLILCRFHSRQLWSRCRTQADLEALPAMLGNVGLPQQSERGRFPDNSPTSTPHASCKQRPVAGVAITSCFQRVRQDLPTIGRLGR